MKSLDRSLASASIIRIGSGSQRTYSVEDAVFFDEFPSVIFGVAWPRAGAVGVVLLADHAKRFSAIGAWFTVGGADNTNALHWLAIASAIP